MFAAKKKPGSASRPNTRRKGLQVESLEDRKMMTIGMTFGGGVLTIVGEDTMDIITVYQQGYSTMVQHTNSAGVTNLYDTGPNVYLDISTGGGNDIVYNASGLAATINGGSGDDKLYGGYNNDTLYGGPGYDNLYGGASDDWLWCGANDDYAVGGDDADAIDGGTGNDDLWGGSGNDNIVGGAGADDLHGEDGHDALWGAGWNNVYSYFDGLNVLQGGTGNDSLYGGNGTDYMYGNDDNDGLFGGGGSKNILWGGRGADRFLVRTSDTLGVLRADNAGDVKAEDARVNFAAGKRNWTDAQIAQVDAALNFLHTQTNNTRLLELSNGSAQTFSRFNSLKGAALADNDSAGTIRVANSAFTSSPPLVENIIHELGHNWDKESTSWQGWQNLSGWKVHNNGNGSVFAPDGYIASTDGKWDYVWTASNSFARDYGRTSPMEDWCTSWEAYFEYKTGTLSASEVARLQTKLNAIDAFMASNRT